MRRLGTLLAVAAAAAALAAWRLRLPPHAPEPSGQIAAVSLSKGSDVSPLSREAEGGRLLFDRYCTSCHGRQGDGFGINAPNLPVEVPSLTTASRVGAWPDPQLFDRIVRGSGTPERRPVCPPWGRRLTGRDIDALVAFVRVLSRGSPVDDPTG